MYKYIDSFNYNSKTLGVINTDFTWYLEPDPDPDTDDSDEEDSYEVPNDPVEDEGGDD